MKELSRQLQVNYFSRSLVQPTCVKIKVQDSTKNNLTVYNEMPSSDGSIFITTDEWERKSYYSHLESDEGNKKKKREDEQATESDTDSSSSEDELSDEQEDQDEVVRGHNQEGFSDSDVLASIRLTVQIEDCKQHFRVFLRPELKVKPILDLVLSIGNEIPLQYIENCPTSHFMELLKTSWREELGFKRVETLTYHNNTNNKNTDLIIQEDETYEDFENFILSVEEDKKLPSNEGILTGLRPISDRIDDVIDGPTHPIGTRVHRLFEAIKIREASLLQTLIKKMYGFVKYGPGPLNAVRDEYGRSLLHCCVLYNSKRCLHNLLNKFNLNTELVDSEGRTSLHVAARTGQIETVKMLLNKDANVHARARFDYTPLHFAAEKGYVAIVKLLLEAGAKVYHHTANGRLPSDLTANRMVKEILNEEETRLIHKVSLLDGDNRSAIKSIQGKIRGTAIYHE